MTTLRRIETRSDAIYHLAAIISGDAEADFAMGYRTNLDGMRHLFEAIRTKGTQVPYKLRVASTSSVVAVVAGLAVANENWITATSRVV